MRSETLNAALRWSGVAFMVREVLQRRKVTILMYHEIEPELLDRQLAVLGRRYNFVALRDYLDAARSGSLESLPPKPLVVTFDDGFKSLHELTRVFRKHCLRPSVFVSTGIVGTNRRFWWLAAESETEFEHMKQRPADELAGLLASRGYTETTSYPERCALSDAEIREMCEFVDFQAHTVFHPVLTMCSDERSWFEIDQGKRDLKEKYGVDAFAFAYPNGEYSAREIEYLSQAGYECAVTIEPGFNGLRANLFRLKRLNVDSASSTNAILGRACGLAAWLKHALRHSSQSAPTIRDG